MMIGPNGEYIPDVRPTYYPPSYTPVPPNYAPIPSTTYVPYHVTPATFPPPITREEFESLQKDIAEIKRALDKVK